MSMILTVVAGKAPHGKEPTAGWKEIIKAVCHLSFRQLIPCVKRAASTDVRRIIVPAFCLVGLQHYIRVRTLWSNLQLGSK